MTDTPTEIAESAAVNEMRANRWKNQPEGAEEEYEARCAHWESLTVADIWGPDGEPPFPPIAHKSSDAAYAAEDVTDPTPAPLPADPWSVTK